MATIVRPPKEGSATTYQAKVGLGFVDILASEMDADLDTIYAAWNGGADSVNIKDGSVTAAKLATDAKPWTLGTTIFPADASKVVALGTSTNNPLQWGGSAGKGHLLGPSAATSIQIAANATYNAGATAFVQDSTALASWILTLNPATSGVFGVSRIAPGGTTATDLLIVDSTGSMTITGNLTAANTGTFNTANPTGKSNIQAYSTTGIYFAVNDRWSPPVPGAASWNLEMDTAGHATLVHRAASAGNGTTDHSHRFQNDGSMVITGNIGQKLTGTVWLNPSDRRLKDAIEDYTTGLAAIVQLEPRTFVYNGKGGSPAGMRGYGFVADEVAPVMPDMVGVTTSKLNADDEDETEIQTLDQSNLILALVNAVRELAARVAALEGPA